MVIKANKKLGVLFLAVMLANGMIQGDNSMLWAAYKARHFLTNDVQGGGVK